MLQDSAHFSLGVPKPRDVDFFTAIRVSRNNFVNCGNYVIFVVRPSFLAKNGVWKIF